METTPNTVSYMIAGHIVFAIVLIAYLISLIVRWKNLQREEQTLQEMQK